MSTWFDNLDPEQRNSILASLDTPAGREAIAYAADGPREFYAWLTAANLLCIERYDLSLFELNDVGLRVHFNDGLTPHEALSIAISNTAR